VLGDDLELRRKTIERSDVSLRLREMAMEDPLTGLANRALFDEILELELRPRRHGHLGLLFCDMTGFKRVNDHLGHGAGDQLLKITAERLSKAARKGELVARLGGDELVVVCPRIDQAAELLELATRLTVIIAQPARIVEVEIIPSVSMGA
jgi:diguanylate cyclase (GGDEF)-like protein